MCHPKRPYDLSPPGGCGGYRTRGRASSQISTDLTWGTVAAHDDPLRTTRSERPAQIQRPGAKAHLGQSRGLTENNLFRAIGGKGSASAHGGESQP